MDFLTNRAFDFIIIGGGVSGLYAAQRALETWPKCNVLLLERRKRIGGRIKISNELKDRTGKSVSTPMGAGFIRRSDKRLLSLIKKLGLKTVGFDVSVVSRRLACDQLGSTTRLPKEELERLLKEWVSLVVQNGMEIMRGRYSFEQFLRRFYPSTVVYRIINHFTYTDFLKADVLDTLNYYPKEDFFWETGAEANPLILVDGWNSLIDGLLNSLLKYKGRFTYYKEAKVHSIEESSLGVKVHFKHLPTSRDYPVMGKRVFYATTVNALAELHPDWRAVKEIRSQSFAKVFSSHSVPFQTGVSLYFTPNTPFRKTIMFDSARGVALAAYCDGSDADYWRDIAKQNNGKDSNTSPKNKIKALLQSHFDDLSAGGAEKVNFGRVLDVNIKYWKEGVHYYVPIDHVEGDKLLNREEILLRHYIHPTKRSFVCGEMVSLNQGWTEGAVESVDRLFQQFKKEMYSEG